MSGIPSHNQRGAPASLGPWKHCFRKRPKVGRFGDLRVLNDKLSAYYIYCWYIAGTCNQKLGSYGFPARKQGQFLYRLFSRLTSQKWLIMEPPGGAGYQIFTEDVFHNWKSICIQNFVRIPPLKLALLWIYVHTILNFYWASVNEPWIGWWLEHFCGVFFHEVMKNSH